MTRVRQNLGKRKDGYSKGALSARRDNSDRTNDELRNVASAINSAIAEIKADKGRAEEDRLWNRRVAKAVIAYTLLTSLLLIAGSYQAIMAGKQTAEIVNETRISNGELKAMNTQNDAIQTQNAAIQAQNNNLQKEARPYIAVDIGNIAAPGFERSNTYPKTEITITASGQTPAISVKVRYNFVVFDFSGPQPHLVLYPRDDQGAGSAAGSITEGEQDKPEIKLEGVGNIKLNADGTLSVLTPNLPSGNIKLLAPNLPPSINPTPWPVESLSYELYAYGLINADGSIVSVSEQMQRTRSEQMQLKSHLNAVHSTPLQQPDIPSLLKVLEKLRSSADDYAEDNQYFSRLTETGPNSTPNVYIDRIMPGQVEQVTATEKFFQWSEFIDSSVSAGNHNLYPGLIGEVDYSDTFGTAYVSPFCVVYLSPSDPRRCDEGNIPN